MEKTWRWFGRKDPITLDMLRQIGVEGIVTALHNIPLGEVWPREEIRSLREEIERHGMRWSVVESLPVTETIKYAGKDRDEQIEIYKQSMRNLAAEGVKTIATTLCLYLTGQEQTLNILTPTVHLTSTLTVQSLRISIFIY